MEPCIIWCRHCHSSIPATGVSNVDFCGSIPLRLPLPRHISPGTLALFFPTLLSLSSSSAWNTYPLYVAEMGRRAVLAFGLEGLAEGMPPHGQGWQFNRSFWPKKRPQYRPQNWPKMTFKKDICTNYQNWSENQPKLYCKIPY